MQTHSDKGTLPSPAVVVYFGHPLQPDFPTSVWYLPTRQSKHAPGPACVWGWGLGCGVWELWVGVWGWEVRRVDLGG